MVTYLAASIVTAVLFAATAGVRNAITELAKLNWASIVGLEIGYIYLYRNGCKVSAGSVIVI